MRREASHDCGRSFLLQAEPPPQHLSSKLLHICCCWALSQPHEVRHLELFKPPRSQLCETKNWTELCACGKLKTHQSQTKSTQDDGQAPCQLALQTTVAECIPDPLYLTSGDLRYMQPHMLFMVATSAPAATVPQERRKRGGSNRPIHNTFALHDVWDSHLKGCKRSKSPAREAS